ncbi:MAG: ATP-binding cassette domain-containing protein [Wenzhouxiangellaceae bacterium]|nr:ATP-binding cassette domain-containing protein [Wenzhouxiangellaceae bacterium]
MIKLIQITDIYKVFYADDIETDALAGIQLGLAPGEYVSISGPSGCGKSTLLSLLGLLDTPTGGHYTRFIHHPIYCVGPKPRVYGVAAEDINVSQRAKIRNKGTGFIFQAFSLIGDRPPRSRRPVE